MYVDNIIFGDNQFFGINHVSEATASRQLEKFSRLENIIKVLDIAYSTGISGFMLTANERVDEIAAYLREHSDYWGKLNIYPSIPYPHKYVRKVVEKGMYGAFTEMLSDGRKSVMAILKGGMATVKKDINQMMKSLIDVELRKYHGLNLKVVFLQNIITDLMLGIGLNDILFEYNNYIESKYGVKAGFITMNLTMLVSSLKEMGIKKPIIMAPCNKKGFFMNPSRQVFEDTLANQDIEFVAMSVLASGAIPPREAIEYVFEHKEDAAVIYGSSTDKHIKETKKLIEEFQRV